MLSDSGAIMVVAGFVCLVIFVIGGGISISRCDEISHEYAVGERVVLWLNHIGPYANPQERYDFEAIPLCLADDAENAVDLHNRSRSIGETLGTTNLQPSRMNIWFRVNSSKRVLCAKTFDDMQTSVLKYAVDNVFWYQLSLDDLPIWGMLGTNREDYGYSCLAKSYPAIWLYQDIRIGFNGNRIIEVNMMLRDCHPLKANESLEFFYSVEWVPMATTFHERFDRYLDYGFFEHQIHWFSVFNSIMVVCCLFLLVSIVVLKAGKAEYSFVGEKRQNFAKTDVKNMDDSVRKQFQSDVFRAPHNALLYSTFCGIGVHLFLLIIFEISSAILGSLHIERGGLVSAALLIFAFASVGGGYTSGKIYKQLCPDDIDDYWIFCMFLTASLVPFMCCITLLFLNMISVLYGTLSVIPFHVFLWLSLMWTVVILPLCFIGTLLGRKSSHCEPNLVASLNSVPGNIPSYKWATHPYTVCILTGCIPFSAIFIEIFFIFTSFWSYKFYYVWGFCLIVAMLMIIAAGCVAIIVTDFFLSAGDYRWRWISFLSGASTGMYVFLYSIYFYFVRTQMSGAVQTTFYFTYSFLFCFALSMICGTVGTAAAGRLVPSLMERLKQE